MSQHPQHFQADSLEVPAHLPARQRLEWEVAQLADGTLAAPRRKAVEAALLSDAELRSSYEAHRRLSGMLRKLPPMDVDLAGEIMRSVRLEPAYGDPVATAAGASQGGASSLLELARDWWLTVTAAAAALVVGVGLGSALFNAGESEPGIAVTPVEHDDSQFASTMRVAGPGEILRQQQASSDSADGRRLLAITVSGPEFLRWADPELNSSLPESAVVFGGSAVVETSRELLITGVASP